MGQLEPGRDVRVVVELRAEDLVARLGSRAGRAREREDERRHVRAEDDLVRRRSRGSGRRSPASARRAPRCGGSSRTGRSCSRSTCGSSRRPRRSPRPGPASRRGRRRRRARAGAPRSARGRRRRRGSRGTPPTPARSSASRSGASPALPRPLGDVAGGLGERPEGQPVGDRAVDGDELEGGVARRRWTGSSTAGRSTPSTPCSARNSSVTQTTSSRAAGVEHRARTCACPAARLR